MPKKVEQDYVLPKYRCKNKDCKNKRYYKVSKMKGYCLSCFYSKKGKNKDE